jgi:uncharacterized protein
MANNIGSDLNRFKDLVKKRVGDNIHKFIGHEKMIARHGKKTVSIPLDYINLPHFTFGGKDKGGTGQGDGEAGDPVNGQGKGKGKGKGKGEGEAGDEHEEHDVGPEFTSDELAQILMDKLELPNIEPRGTDKLSTEKARYNRIGIVGNESLRHNRRSYKESLKRTISSGHYQPGDAVVIEKQDKRYKDSSTTTKPEVACTLFFMRDISGSMGEEQCKLSLAIAYWVDLLLRKAYGEIRTVWIVFDTEASIVETREEFFNLRAGGGTRITSGIQLVKELTDSKYRYAESNNYAYLFSDGDCHSSDNTAGVEALHALLPNLNNFSYGQVKNAGGGEGEFMKTMTEHFSNHERVSMAQVNNDEDILGAIKAFFTPKK